MSQPTNALIDHLDKSLAAASGKRTPEQPEIDSSEQSWTISSERAAFADEKFTEMQRLIATDEEITREWQYLQLAVDAIRDAGLYEQVATVRKHWQAQLQAETGSTALQAHIPTTLLQQTPAAMEQAREKPAGGVVRPLYRNMMRVAACLLLVAGVASIFKYVRLSSSSLYSDYYTTYELNTSRGSATQDAMERAYAGKNWTMVLSLFSAAKEQNNKTDFLAGMADLELKKFDDAIAHFEQVIATNSRSGGDYFEDEAEYYLAISWLAKNKINEAMPMLEKIRAKKDHLYHDRVARMSFLDLRLVQYKENK